MKLQICIVSSLLLSPLLAEKSVEDHMNDIKKPMKQLKKMDRVKMSSGAQYNKAAKELLRAGLAFGKYLDSEDQFNKLNKDFQTALQKYRSALRSKKHDKIRAGFQLVKTSCTDCHDVYKQD